MQTMRYEPWSLVGQLHREMDNLMRRDADNSNSVSDWTPAMDIYESEQAYTLYADIPGVNAADIEIHMEDGLLSISGQRTVNATDEQTLKRNERVQGSFHRRFSLPDSVNGDAISAKSQNGVLEVHIPKQEKVLPRKIQVQIVS